MIIIFTLFYKKRERWNKITISSLISFLIISLFDDGWLWDDDDGGKMVDCESIDPSVLTSSSFSICIIYWIGIMIL